MGYVVVVFAIINTAALVGVAWLLLHAEHELVALVGTVIQDEVRKQDDRIEKRLAKREGPPENNQEVDALGKTILQVGQPYRR